MFYATDLSHCNLENTFAQHRCCFCLEVPFHRSSLLHVYIFLLQWLHVTADCRKCGIDLWVQCCKCFLIPSGVLICVYTNQVINEECFLCICSVRDWTETALLSSLSMGSPPIFSPESLLFHSFQKHWRLKTVSAQPQRKLLKNGSVAPGSLPISPTTMPNITAGLPAQVSNYTSFTSLSN